MIIGITHTDGYYSECDQIPLEERSSNTYDCVVEGVNMILDASNHESISGNLFRGVLKGYHDVDVSMKPGYCIGGFNLDYFNQIIINRNSPDRFFTYRMNNTRYMKGDLKIKKKYDDILKKIYQKQGLPIVSTTLKNSYNFLRSYEKPNTSLAKVLFEYCYETFREKYSDKPKVKGFILPAGAIRTMDVYKSGDEFETGDMKKIFAFGLEIVFFLAKEKNVYDFFQKFKKGAKNTGGYPTIYPEPFKDNDVEYVYCLTSYHKSGGDNYPFAENESIDKFDMLKVILKDGAKKF